MTTRFADHLLDGDHASRPAATAVPTGTLYSCSDHALVYQSDGSTWATWATLGASGSTLGTLGYAQATANQTGITSSATDLTGLAATVTAGTSRRLRITGMVTAQQLTANGVAELSIYEGATRLKRSLLTISTNVFRDFLVQAVVTPSAGSHTYKLTMQTSAGSISVFMSSTDPGFILVEDIGT